MHSIKIKILSIYAFLILLIALVAIVSVNNLYSLNKSVDGLIEANYKSIVAARNMLNALERQDSYELIYIQGESENSIRNFQENQKEFYTWLTKARDNITEAEETEEISKITDNYMKYTEYFLRLTDIENTKGSAAAGEFYNKNINSLFKEIKTGCENLLAINEKAMFRSKDRVTVKSRNQVYGTTVISVFSILIGLLAAIIYTRKIVNPIKVLISGVKSVREGNLNHEITVPSRDEIGELAQEFNNMTRRLFVYEKSNIKNLIFEKNKSLAIVKSISDPIIVTDKNHMITLLNKSAEDMFGITEKESMGKHFLEYINNEAIFKGIKSVNVKGEKADKGDIIKIEKKDKNYYYILTTSPILGEDEVSVGTVTVLQDITGLKEIEEMKSDFISTVSHELRTPLTSILMGTGLLLDSVTGGLNEDQREIVEAMDEDSRQLLNLVNDLLDLSKLESGKMQLHSEMISIENLVRNSTKSFEDIARERGVIINSYIKDGLPEVMVDSNKISIVVNNLIANALKFTSQGDEIKITAEVLCGYMRVTVSDTGPGIPEEYHEVIFDKFTQLQQNGSSETGTGLGLAISKGFVEKHGGNIWVESGPGKGSSFIFTLPL